MDLLENFHLKIENAGDSGLYAVAVKIDNAAVHLWI